MQLETELLIRLQSVDLQAKLILEKKEQGPRKLLDIGSRIKAKEEELAAIFEQQTELKKKKKEQETQLEDEITHLKKCQSKLMNVKTNREYQALLKEIEEIKKGNRKREDEIVSSMEDAERLESEIQAKQDDLNTIKGEIEAERAKVERLTSHCDAQLAEFEHKRKMMTQGIPEELLKRYDFLRSKRNGLAIVGVENSVCLGCHMNIPPQLFNELLREEDLKACPSCQRIIYVYSAARTANGE